MNNKELSCEEIASKLSYFYEQLHLYHLQTSSYAEHKALNGMYDFVASFKDTILEQLQGYKGVRLKAYTIAPLKSHSPGSSTVLINEIKEFSKSLKHYAQMYEMEGIDSINQDLEGECAKTLYLLTLS